MALLRNNLVCFYDKEDYLLITLLVYIVGLHWFFIHLPDCVCTQPDVHWFSDDRLDDRLVDRLVVGLGAGVGADVGLGLGAGVGLGLGAGVGADVGKLPYNWFFFSDIPKFADGLLKGSIE